MDRCKAKEKLKYVDKLDAEPRSRYMNKLTLLNGFDPYDSAKKDWSQDANMLPPLLFGDMVNYLVYGRSAYTWDQFKSYKSLEAHNQFTNGWVHELNIFSPDNCDNTVVKAKVLHSMRLNEKPLLPWVILDSTGTVQTAHCDCMAGLAETCTHVGALLFKVEAVVRIREKPTVTGVPAYWMVPGGIDKVQPEVGYKIDFSSSAAKKQELDKAIDTSQAQSPSVRTGPSSKNKKAPRPTQDELKDFFKVMHDTGDKPAVLSVIPDYCELFRDPVKPVLVPKSLRTVRNTKCDGMCRTDIIMHCESLFHDKRVHISEDEAIRIETETKEQHKTPSWYAVRAGRITASQLHPVYTFKFDKPCLSTINNVCYPGQKKVKVPAVQWGLDCERKAVDVYTETYQKTHLEFSVKRSGFLINCEFPYMGASPDGIVFCECCGKGSLEVKCPYKHRSSTILDACKDSNFCLTQKNGQFTLKTSHSYYYQVQCQLLVSGADYCDFCVWTTVDFVVVRVQPNREFLDKCQEKAKEFFVTVVLPELVAKHYTQTLKAVETSTTASSSEHVPNSQQRRPLSVSPQKNVPGSSNKKRSKSKKRVVWCHCRKPEDKDDMVACDNPNCKIEWFHVGCVGLDQLPASDETWICSACLQAM